VSDPAKCRAGAGGLDHAWLAALLAGIVLWGGVSLILDVAEPWDSPGYWPAYLIALALSFAFGHFGRSRAWLSGVLLVFAQIPVMLLQSGPGPLLAVGVMYLAILSLPAALIAVAAARLRPA